MGCVTQEECPTLAKVVGHTMMHAIRRKPANRLYVGAHQIHQVFVDVVPPGRVSRTVIPNLPNQASMTRTFHWKEREKVSAVHCAVHFTIHDRADALGVRHVKMSVIRSTGKSNVQLLPHGRTRAVTAGDVLAFAARFTVAIRSELCAHARGLICNWS